VRDHLLAAVIVASVSICSLAVASQQNDPAGQSDGKSQHQGAKEEPDTPLIETTQEKIRPTSDPAYLIKLEDVFSPELLAIFYCTFPLDKPPAKGCKPVPIQLKIKIELTDTDATVKPFLISMGFSPLCDVDTKKLIGTISPRNLTNLFGVTDRSGKRILKFVSLANKGH
jgi:hypothetical protein